MPERARHSWQLSLGLDGHHRYRIDPNAPPRVVKLKHDLEKQTYVHRAAVGAVAVGRDVREAVRREGRHTRQRQG